MGNIDFCSWLVGCYHKVQYEESHTRVKLLSFPQLPLFVLRNTFMGIVLISLIIFCYNDYRYYLDNDDLILQVIGTIMLHLSYHKK